MLIIESERLLLRRVNLDDVDDLYREVFSNLEVVQYTFGKEIKNKVQAQRAISWKTVILRVFLAYRR